MQNPKRHQYLKRSVALGGAAAEAADGLDGLAAEEATASDQSVPPSPDGFTLSRHIPIERALLPRRWLLVLMVFILSAVSQAHPPLGLPSVDPASVGMSAEVLAAHGYATAEIQTLLATGAVAAG